MFLSFFTSGLKKVKGNSYDEKFTNLADYNTSEGNLKDLLEEFYNGKIVTFNTCLLLNTTLIENVLLVLTGET